VHLNCIRLMSKSFNLHHGSRYKRKRGQGRSDRHGDDVMSETQMCPNFSEQQKTEMFGRKCFCGQRGRHSCVGGNKNVSVEEKLSNITRNSYGLRFIEEHPTTDAGTDGVQLQHTPFSTGVNTACASGETSDRHLRSEEIADSEIESIFGVVGDTTSPFYIYPPTSPLVPTQRTSVSPVYAPDSAHVNMANVNKTIIGKSGVKSLESNNPVSPIQGAKASVSSDPLPVVESSAFPVSCVVEYQPNFINRVFGYLPSRFDFNQINNHYTRELFGLKDSLRLFSDQQIIESLYKYLIVNKFDKYNNRAETVEHMHKLGIKYLNENKIDYAKQSNVFVNKFLLTLQKAADETDSKLLLAYQNPNEQKGRMLPVVVATAGLLTSMYCLTKLKPLTSVKLIPLGLLGLACAYKQHKSNLNF
jgi:hypothetical protein